MVRGVLSVFKFFLQVGAILVITHVYYEIRMGQDFENIERMLSLMPPRLAQESSQGPVMEVALQIIHELVSMATR